MHFHSGNLSNQTLLHLYKALIKPRLIEEKMLILLRQGQVGKWFSGIGQEAISVGLTEALHPEEYILPLHRNLGVFTSRNIPLFRLFAQWQGKASGFTKGRDRSFHFGTNEYHIVGMISHLGAMLGVADGIALAEKLGSSGRIAAVFSGDGGASEGDFHEALNVAAVWNLPVLFVIENNGYGLSTPSNEQFRFKQFIDKGIGYGMETAQVDGNNILEVYQKVRELAESMRNNPRPVLLECITFRMRGHEEASGTKYVPQELFDTWAKKDPIANYETYLLEQGILTEEIKKAYSQEIKAEITEALAAFDEPEPHANDERELQDVFTALPDVALPAGMEQDAYQPASTDGSPRRLVDALSEGLSQAMEAFPNLILMGQDIADYGGVFKITQDFVNRFGKDRVRNTPLCESAILGAAYGLAIKRHKAMVEMQFADFVSCGFNQIVNNLAKSHYRWEQPADVVVRMPTGAGVAAGPFHSQSTEAWFTHVAGLKVVYPSNPYDAKGLLLASFADPNPVLFFEHKYLYRLPELEQVIPANAYTLPIGKARVVKSGEEVTVITYGWGVHQAIAALHELGINGEVIDLRTLVPWDKETVFNSVRKTGKALVLHEDTLTGGFGAEIVACISKECFTSLDAPIFRTGALDTPVPLAPALEQGFLPWKRLRSDLMELAAY